MHALRAISHINLLSRNEGYTLWSNNVTVAELDLDLTKRTNDILAHLKLRIDASNSLDPKLWYFHLLSGVYNCSV